MVIRKYKELISLTRPYVVAASCMAHSNCDAQLSNTPSLVLADISSKMELDVSVSTLYLSL